MPIDDTRLRPLVGFGLFGLAWWLFANIYEEIVLLPNFLTDSGAKREHWLAFFTEIDQIPYFLPLTPIALVALIVAWRRARGIDLRKELRVAVLAAGAGFAITAVIVPVVNLKLFRPGPLTPEQVYTLAVTWMALNVVRIASTAVASWKTLSAWTRVSRPR